MIYHEFGKTGIKVSALGFGAMRLPTKEMNGKHVIDEDKALEMFDKAFELGVNYVDTAPGYHEGNSEYTVGKALKGRRDKLYLSTKNPVDNGTEKGFWEHLETSLKKLDTDYIDFYHFWGINLKSYEEHVTGRIAAAQKAKEQGLIRHISFSFHDKPENMIPIIDSGYFESVLCQYNLLDRALEDQIAYAKQKGLGVVIMGPVGGGRLGAPSPVIMNMLKGKVKSTAEMALRFVLANPNVSIALSGMSSLDMVIENAKVASIEGTLTTAEQETVAQMLEENRRLSELYCTGCNYCMPCPKGVAIPQVFSAMNYKRVYGLDAHAKAMYRGLVDKKNDASQCVRCGACEKKCPQKLPIIKQLQDCQNALA